MKAQTLSRAIALLFFNLSVRCGCVVNVMPRSLYPRDRDPVPIVQQVGWALGSVWAYSEDLAVSADGQALLIIFIICN